MLSRYALCPRFFAPMSHCLAHRNSRWESGGPSLLSALALKETLECRLFPRGQSELFLERIVPAHHVLDRFPDVFHPRVEEGITGPHPLVVLGIEDEAIGQLLVDDSVQGVDPYFQFADRLVELF